MIDESHSYIKARLKTQDQLAKVYPEAESWGKPLEPGCLFRSADEVILPYIGRTIWVRKKRIDLNRFYWIIKDTDGLVVLPDWIEYFETEGLVPSAGWDDPEGEVDDDTWLEWYEDRWTIIEDLLIVTG